MVKIIGKDETAVKRVTCKSCASRLEYILNEVTRTTVRDYGGGSDDYNFIKCPCCWKDVEVKGY